MLSHFGVGAASRPPLSRESGFLCRWASWNSAHLWQFRVTGFFAPVSQSIRRSKFNSNAGAACSASRIGGSRLRSSHRSGGTQGIGREARTSVSAILLASATTRLHAPPTGRNALLQANTVTEIPYRQVLTGFAISHCNPDGLPFAAVESGGTSHRGAAITRRSGPQPRWVRRPSRHKAGNLAERANTAAADELALVRQAMKGTRRVSPPHESRQLPSCSLGTPPVCDDATAEDTPGVAKKPSRVWTSRPRRR